MREYAKSAPTFWTGVTGKQIRALGRDAQVVAFYLYTCPSSNWIGLYYLPMPTLCHEVGISREGASKALQCLSEIDFAHYDAEMEVVWVPGAAKYQIAAELKPGDKRIKGIIKDLVPYINHRFFKDFYDRYREIYHLVEEQAPSKPLTRPSEGPPKPEGRAGAESRAESRAGAGAEDKAASRQKRASRTAPADFSVSEEMRAWHKQECPDVDIETETKLFRNHEFEKPKTDWVKTWQNWMLQERKYMQRNGKNQAKADAGQESVFKRAARKLQEKQANESRETGAVAL